MNIKKDLINIVISLVVTIGLSYLYVALKQEFPAAFLPVIFLLVLIFLEVASMQKKK